MKKRCIMNNMKTKVGTYPNMFPLDVFFNIERYEGKTLAHLFLRVMNTYHEIPSNLKPPYMEFLNKIVKLRISPKDPDVKLLL